MSSEWSTSSLDLHLDADLSRRHGRSQRLAAAVRAAIETGRLPPGARMPSTRSMAQDLQVARGTVTSAYEQLATAGYLEVVHGSGTRVADLRARPDAREEGTPPAAGPAPRWNLRPGLPDVTLFPRTAWVTATQRVLREAPAEALDYGDPRGRPELRAALAHYLGRARGVVAQPERIVVCHGYTQALGLLAKVVAGLKTPTMAFEDPSYPLFREIVRTAGLATVSAEVDEEGLRVDSIGPARAVVVTPMHQYPLGVALSRARREQLIAWARAADGVVIEDDYDGEFQFHPKPSGALQALDPERVVYAGTTSKTLAPGLRLAWLVLPRDWVEPVAVAKRIADQHSAALGQMVLAQLISSGAYDRHIRRCRTRYRDRRQRLAAILAEKAPSTEIVGRSAGLHALVRWSPEGPTEREVLQAARRESLALSALGDYWAAEGPHAPGLVVGYATPPQHGYTGALEALTRALDRAFGRR
ncbi:MocR-like pyridoxine biosynthesis transcription factor PdxR [Peterkaempfera griseoplana]|uniref:MocR-like pyridoxine biosynthesis transcription factor PdxR n=1 Tax=Peterkaempfera griseoplana TaxID=66896 RepID=UPI0006E2BFE4|nr:PLP-dependent aminotransferase family protein [Peterkaempfera griseoplana]BCN13468.1 DNA-binding domain/PLP-dependent aminotransferase [Peterkaempfera griseoplana]